MRAWVLFTLLCMEKAACIFSGGLVIKVIIIFPASGK